MIPKRLNTIHEASRTRGAGEARADHLQGKNITMRNLLPDVVDTLWADDLAFAYGVAHARRQTHAPPTGGGRSLITAVRNWWANVPSITEGIGHAGHDPAGPTRPAIGRGIWGDPQNPLSRIGEVLSTRQPMVGNLTA